MNNYLTLAYNPFKNVKFRLTVVGMYGFFVGVLKLRENDPIGCPSP
jgi:hypothetical protein